MFDLGMSEMLVVGTVALIVVGPKDLPGLFRTVGRFVGKAKGMAREFSSAMNNAADETGMRDMAKGLKSATNPVGSAMDSIKNATRDLTSSIDPTKFGADSETGKLSAERAEKARKIQASTARMAAERKEREAQDALAKAEEAEAVLEKKPAAKKPTAKKTPAKKAASKTGANIAVKTAAKTGTKTSKAKTPPAKKAPVKKAVAKTKIKAGAKPAAKAKGTT